MRLIDADELKECLRWCEVFRLSIKEICDDYIDTAPTVDISKLRPRGEWIMDKDTGLIGCSHCHIVWLRGKTAYCPNCGAKMM
jgi:hypothetical protein